MLPKPAEYYNHPTEAQDHEPNAARSTMESLEQDLYGGQDPVAISAQISYENLYILPRHLIVVRVRHRCIYDTHLLYVILYSIHMHVLFS